MANWFLVIIYLSFISLGLPDSLLGAVWPVMQPDIGASFESAGFVSMIVAGGTIVSSLVSGSLIQRFGTGNLTLISCGLTAGALLGFSLAPSLLWLLLLAIPLGLGGGAVDAALNHYVASHYKAHHMNWLHCFWGVGATLGPIIMSYYIATGSSWRAGYTTVSIIQFGLVILLFASLPLWKRMALLHKSLENQPYRETVTLGQAENGADKDEENYPHKQIKPINLRGVKNTLIAFLFYCGVEAMVGLWGASFLVSARNISAETAAGWVSLYYGGITVGRFITGFVTLRLSNRVLILIGQLTAAVGGVLLLLPLPDVVSLFGFILLGLGFAPIYPGLIHETPTRFGQENSAKLIGYQMAVAYTGTTLVPPLFGIFATLTNISLFPIVVLGLVALMLFNLERVNRLIKPGRI
jgi:fucose permease